MTATRIPGMERGMMILLMTAQAPAPRLRAASIISWLIFSITARMITAWKGMFFHICTSRIPMPQGSWINLRGSAMIFNFMRREIKEAVGGDDGHEHVGGDEGWYHQRDF